MGDTTGYEAETTDVEAMVAWLAEVPDPLERYSRATAEQVLYQTAAERLRDIRGAALAELNSRNDSTRLGYTRLSRLVGLSPARVQQMVERARDTRK